LLAKGAFFVFFSCLWCEACLFEAIFININKNNNKNEARAKEIKKNKNATFAPPRRGGARGGRTSFNLLNFF
jgi:hypothetical protein